MRIKLAYGKTGLWIDLSDTWNITLVEPAFVPGLPDPAGDLAAVLRQPIDAAALRERVAPAHKVGIIFSDITRPTPNHVILPVVLRELAEAGVPRDRGALPMDPGDGDFADPAVKLVLARLQEKLRLGLTDETDDGHGPGGPTNA